MEIAMRRLHHLRGCHRLPPTATLTPAGPRRVSAMGLPLETRIFSILPSSSSVSPGSPRSKTTRVFGGLRRSSTAVADVEDKTQPPIPSSSGSTAAAGKWKRISEKQRSRASSRPYPSAGHARRYLNVFDQQQE